MNTTADDWDYSMNTLCKHCEHFVEPNDPKYVAEMAAAGLPICTFLHLEDGDQEFDHDAEPSDQTKPGDVWWVDRPDLFREHADGNIGPNSIHHSRRGKVDANMEKQS